MHTTLAVQITEQDIKNGIAHHCQKCAGALALRRAMKNRGLDVKDISCFGGVLLPIEDEKMGYPRISYISEVNAALQKWQHTFDNWKSLPKDLKPAEPLPAEFILFLEC